ncbi:MAG: hypothetical protein Q7U18_00525 [Methylobacter sp.]|nr:hypothetical protein [Methylobacter sp.]
MKLLSRFSICLCFLFYAHLALALDEIEVVTLNQYLGADLAPVLAASPEEFNEALVGVLQKVSASDFKARALEQARMIAKRSPEIIGLQEVWDLTCIDLDPRPEFGCDDPSIANAFVDHLDLTLAALNNTPEVRRKKGISYEVAATVKNLDLEKVTVPGLPFSGIPFCIKCLNAIPNAILVAVDRDVILARRDVQVAKVDWSAYESFGLCTKPSVDGCNYQVVAAVDSLGIAIERGFVAVDVTMGNKVYRIVNTHFEVKGEDVGMPEFTFYQAAQADELLQTLDMTTPTDYLMVLGDMNSSPEQTDIPGVFPPPFVTGITTPYHQFVDSGYHDVWELRPGKASGYTCCQNEDLDSKKSLLTERIDMIFTREMPKKVKQARVLGDKVSTKTNPPGLGLGLWSTDHGGIAAKIQF